MAITQIQDHANERSVAISIKAAKISARLLAKAMQSFLKKAREPTAKHGKQSLKSLTRRGATIENIEISGDNIGSFKKIARKYNIDFALKKDTAAEPGRLSEQGASLPTSPPNWIVFFKAKDSKALELAFKEYSKEVLKHKTQKQSVDKVLAKATEAVAAVPAPTPVKNKGEREL